MSYFDQPENVADYLTMCAELPPSFLTQELQKYLPDQASVLELGMGPGHDLTQLSERYNTTGSDSSKWFLDHYRQTHPQANLLLLDALTVSTQITFDAIYSNKVLHQLSPQQLATSFKHQARALNENGITLHSFWKGTGAEDFAGDTTYYYEAEFVMQMMAADFEILDCQQYDEMSPDDSFWIVSRKK